MIRNTLPFLMSLCLFALIACNEEAGKTQENKLVEKGGFKKAADKILQGTPQDLNEEEILRTAQFFSEKTKYTVSIPLLRKLLELNPESSPGKLLLANNLRQTGEYNEALEFYNELVSIDSIKFIVLPERARLYTHLTEFQKATVDIEKARSLQSKYFAVFLADGLLQYAQGRQQEALDLFDIAMDLDPGVSSEAALYSGFILLNNNLNYDALGKFTKAIDIGRNINVGYAYINRGVCQINLQDTAYACQDWDSGAYYMPEQANTYIDQYCPR